MPSWAQEVPWSDDGSKSSSAEEQFEAIKKDELMQQCERDLVSGGVDVLAKMDAKQAEELWKKQQENMTGIPEEKRKMAVWRRMWMAEKRKEGQRENEERRKAEGRERETEEGKATDERAIAKVVRRRL